MKSTLRRFAAIAALTTTAAMSTLTAVTPSIAQSNQFGQKEVDQTKFVAVAAPYQGGKAHQLLILEQISDTRQCWSESGANPTLVDPLLLNFDFTGHCGRSTDSNGYSIRVNGEDMGMQYSLRIVRQGEDMLLVGSPRTRGDAMLIGRVGGTTDQFAKISLEPGWKFTKRIFGDRTLGHVYLTHDGSESIAMLSGVGGGGAVTLPPRTTTPAPIATNLTDISRDIYRTEIAQAVNIGFIAGFDDKTFRPNQALTREQLVSMIIGAIDSIPNVNLTVPTQVTSQPYNDVATTRWSAAKIQFARDNNIVSGYQTGDFRPDQAVTRAELMAVLRRAGEYAKKVQGQSAELTGNRSAQTFADTTGHWADSTISQMSAVCGVASPLNETGSNFSPDAPALRNYAAAATLRLLGCVGGAQQTASTSTPQ